ncbi:HesA/MoeB/ThiF family protein [Shimia sediminis]|uniref:HesA/MoeB/ThiF family protein n=1 Tax=Shimia sediminis TaxID=2497945 RepID=UPI000F8E5862|nr:molybdopterin-synthase adenylyltransferase MoeB [Shimia sediminis]
MWLPFFLAAVLWGVGAAMKVPRATRWAIIMVLYLAVLLASFLPSDKNPIRLMSGDTPDFWLLLGGFAIMVLIYRAGLNWLKARVQKPEDPVSQGPFTDTELNRYARHIVLREVGGLGQKKLKDAKVLVVGAGGLGSPALLYLAAAGVGTIGIVDDDEVDNSNLQRQVIHQDAGIGTPKVFSAAEAMTAQNPFVTVKPYHRRLSEEDAAALIADYDLVLDGTDNFDTRYLVNRICVAQGKPLISGALSQWEGQLSVFDPAQGAPCYQCVFPEAPAPGLAPSCAEAGVIGPLPGVIGSMMAVEAVKVIADAGAPLRGEMMIYDALYGESRKITLKRRADCPVCGGKT